MMTKFNGNVPRASQTRYNNLIVPPDNNFRGVRYVYHYEGTIYFPRSTTITIDQIKQDAGSDSFYPQTMLMTVRRVSGNNVYFTKLLQNGIYDVLSPAIESGPSRYRGVAIPLLSDDRDFRIDIDMDIDTYQSGANIGDVVVEFLNFPFNSRQHVFNQAKAFQGGGPV